MVKPPWDFTKYHVGCHQLESLLLGAAQSATPLRTLVVAPISHAFFDLSGNEASKIYSAISGLSELHLGLGPVFENDCGELQPHLLERVLHELAARKIEEFVTAAPLLTSLSVMAPKVYGTDPGRSVNIPLRDFVGSSFHWTKLQRLTLRFVSCEQEELVKLINRHKDTLQRLELAGVSFTSGEWPDCFNALAGTLPQLKKVRLRDSLEATDGRSFEFGEFAYESMKKHYEGDHSPSRAWARAWELYIIQGGEVPIWDLDYDAIDEEEELDGPYNEEEFVQRLAEGDDSGYGSYWDADPEMYDFGDLPTLLLE
ncbi:hypothetical protein LTR86_008444 [Recurvomyces mirabilis]|nr:hypothetical protein LTR86_008444 [Recurvomyces mirabilis]